MTHEMKNLCVLSVLHAGPSLVSVRGTDLHQQEGMA